ncbi:hypothetical protein WICPIJ_002703 [Wickerhamomyces pijperi]|uniref:Phosphoribulokinase/uridine kinase domain-containing protein n=1 Tax=Wickerhamomyces pijperi TaxID=599730 RepID=A0A9P8TPF0_WICPI|nr:hypothetical protein WICPIJ_002703 [Wickerhamomyces pijperi]
MSNTRNIIVAVGGASSSGKTTIAKILHSLIPSSILVHQDDFFKNDKEIPVDPESGYANWDCPEAIDLEAFSKELDYLKQQGQRSNDHSKTYDSDTKDQNIDIKDEKLLSGIQTGLNTIINDKHLKIIFVDGFMLYHDKTLIDKYDIKVFLMSNFQTLKNRREARAGYVTQEEFWVDPPLYFEKIVYPSYVSSHGYLFQTGDPDTCLPEERVCLELGVMAKSNNDGVDTVEGVLQWCGEVLERELVNI